MIKKLLLGAGAAYLARKFIGGRDRNSYDRNGGSGSWFGGSRSARRGVDF